LAPDFLRGWRTGWGRVAGRGWASSYQWQKNCGASEDEWHLL